ncbi:hypothetical protein BN1221_04068 [Brenneria goodwinii]|uniref:Uncharacterized protein n=1 Tax=Brenneria goodwinii TaxID=1109412 RepID=A0A0G4K0E1_9GAMM|nr:hypothetical protein BN1221_04068 [Brenneria goodwinii]
MSASYASAASRMINYPGSVITSILCPEVNPSGSSHLPLMVSCGNGFGLPPLVR